MELRTNKAVHHGKARLGLARTLGRKVTAVGNEEDLDDVEAPGRAERGGGCENPRLLEKTDGGGHQPKKNPVWLASGGNAGKAHLC